MLTTKNIGVKHLGVFILGATIWAVFLKFRRYKLWAKGKFGPFLFNPLLLTICNNDV